MAISILDVPFRGGDLGTRMGQGFSSGVQTGLQNLINWKLQEYGERQRASKNEAYYNTLPGMTPERAKALSQTQPEIQQIGLKEMMQAPTKEAFAKGVASLAQPQNGAMGQQEGLQQLLGQMNPRDALALMTYQQNVGNKAAETAQKATDQQMKFTKGIEPWLTKEDTRAAQINEIGGHANNALRLLEEMGPKNYPSLLGRGVAEISNGWLYPSVKELQNAVGELALAKATNLKGQPTNFKIRLVQSIKPGLSADYKSNIRMLRRYQDVQEALGNRQAFRDNLKTNGQFPTNIESIMSEYDNAMNKPEKHKKFFEQYPQTKEDAHFLSREYELKKMKEENEKFGEKGPKKSQEAAAPTKPIEQMNDLEVLGNPQWFKADSVFKDDKGKRHRIIVKDGTKKWEDL